MRIHISYKDYHREARLIDGVRMTSSYSTPDDGEPFLIVYFAQPSMDEKEYIDLADVSSVTTLPDAA